MKQLTAEWVAKAEGDFNTARRELAVVDQPNHDGVCFHAHQCVKKYLKAAMVEDDVAFPKTRDLSALLRMVLPRQPSWTAFQQECDLLTDSAVEVRYPGFRAGEEDARAALSTAERVRRAARTALELDAE